MSDDTCVTAEVSVPVEALRVVVQGGAPDQAHLDQAIQALRARLATEKGAEAGHVSVPVETLRHALELSSPDCSDCAALLARLGGS